MSLAPGSRTVIEPADAHCAVTSHVDPDEVNQFPLFCPIRAGAFCEPGGEAKVSVISCVTLRAAAGGAHAHYQVWFRVEPAVPPLEGTAPAPGFVPIHVFAPNVLWDLKLHNGALDESAGVASARYVLRLRADPVDDLLSRGTVVTEENVLLATHAGIGGCLSIPTGWDDVANLAIGCVLASDQIQQGRASPSLAAIIEVGRTYSLELAMDFQVEKRVTVKPTALEVSGRNEMNDPPGPIANENSMKWSEFIVTVGDDTGSLQRQIDALRADLAQHGHKYRTGPGVGHNSIEVSTSLPGFPSGGVTLEDEDLDGVEDGADSCPASVAGVPVNALGCSVEDFCALHTRSSDCRGADWAGDGSSPRDCNWKRRECRAAY
jgi:hypothetical protein